MGVACKRYRPKQGVGDGGRGGAEARAAANSFGDGTGVRMPSKVDGRRARGLRTRQAIIDALLELVGEGDVAPTAQRIADRADVSVRSVYQHFSDVEGLFRAAAEQACTTAKEMQEDLDPSWDLEERIELFIAARAAVLEAVLPFVRAARLVEPTSEVLRQDRMSLDRLARAEVARVFGPELDELQGAAHRQMLNALDLLTTWSAWEHLRNSAGPRAAREVMRNGLTALLLGLPSMAA